MLGRGEAIVFVVLAWLGLVIWVFSTPSVAGSLLDGRFSAPVYGYPFFGLPYYALLAFMAGFLFPRGFWLWGIAPFVLPLMRGSPGG